MPIPLNTSIVIPAVPEKTFDSKFYRSFQVRCTPQAGTLYFEVVPMSSSTGELLDQTTEYSCELWEVVANVPEAAAAFTAIINGLPQVETYLINKALEAPNP